MRGVEVGQERQVGLVAFLVGAEEVACPPGIPGGPLPSSRPVCYIPFILFVLVHHVFVHVEAVRLLSESRELPGSFDTVLGGLSA